MIAGAGVGSLLLASEVAFSVVKVAGGAAILIYLGCQPVARGRCSPLHGAQRGYPLARGPSAA